MLILYGIVMWSRRALWFNQANYWNEITLFHFW